MVKFEELEIGKSFVHNGNAWIKRTSRTAYLKQYKMVFYFKKSEIVKLVK